jgi:spore coat polysaccharide biosynthesis protein SpsF
MKRKVIIILQARCTSKRLPNKVLKKISGIPLVILCVKRLANKGHNVIVATSDQKSDDKLVKLLKKNKIKFYRGSLNNVLSRYQEIAKSYNLRDIIVRATSDNPVPDGMLVNILLKEYKKSSKEYIGIDHKLNNLPKGISLEFFSARKILQLKKNITKNDEEHVTLGIYKNKKKYYSKKIKSLLIKKDLSKVSLSIDTQKDYVFTKKIFKKFKNPVSTNFNLIIDECGKSI